MLALVFALAASVTSVPAPQGLEAKLIADAKDGTLDDTALLDAALIASGVPDGEVALEASKLRALMAPAIARARTAPSARGRGDVLLRALHETVLRKYSISASEIDGVSRTGEFNCLSSALLYVVAADGLLEKPRAMVSKHHAYARVTVEGKSVDVETTIASGFDADRKQLMTPAYVKKIAGPGTSPAELLLDLQSPEELPVLSLVAGVYSNRAVALAARGDLAAATIALDRAARLGAGGLKSRATAWRAGVLNNGALALADEGRLEASRDLLVLAMEGVEGETQRLLRANLATTHLQIADAALARKDWTGALLAIGAAQASGAAPNDLSAVRARANAELAALDGTDARCHLDKAPAAEASACLVTLARSLRESDVDTALQHARRAAALTPREPNALSTLFFTLANKARAESERGHCEAVEALVREAAPHMGALQGQKWSPSEVTASCWAHEGDKAFDKKDWEASSKSYARAAILQPKNAALRTNLAAVDLNRAIELAAAGKCDDARPFARRAAQGDKAVAEKTTRVLESCAALRAKQAASDHQWLAAAAELRRGLRDAPASALLKENLGTMIHNAAAQSLRNKNCTDARALLPELDALGNRDTAQAVRSACR